MSLSDHPSRRRRPEVSIVVANWDGGEFLARCLSALQLSARRSGRAFELIVVDDASTDGSAELVRSRFPNACLLENPRNLGFARSVNRGAAWAKGRVLILANNDLVVREEFVESLCRWFGSGAPPVPEGSGKRLFAVSAKTVGWYDGRPNQLCMGAAWRGGRVTPAWSDPAEPAACLFAQAGAAAYDAALFRKLGGLSLLYEPGYWEDYDLSWRADCRGWAQVYDPGAYALHIGGGSMRRRFGDDGVENMKARNHLIFEAANLSSPRLLAEWVLRLPVALARDAARPARERRFTRGLAGMFMRLPGALRQRMALGGESSDLSRLRRFRDHRPSY